MSPFHLRVKLIASILCILALVACALMWREAGLHEPGRKLNFFGGSNRIPFLEQKHPEASITFTAVGLAAFLASLWFSLKALGVADDKEPFWWTHGLGFIMVGAIFGLLLFQARYINGVSHEVWQPGYFLAMYSCGGIIATGLVVLWRALYR